MDRPSKVILPESVLASLSSAKPFLERYLASDRLEPIEKDKASFLTNLAPHSEAVFADGSSSRELIDKLLEHNRLAALTPCPPRGKMDFKDNQGQGEWAEQLLLNAAWPGYKLIPFGPSDGVLPHEPDYEKHRLVYREQTVFEGKRPDLLLFPDSLSEADLAQLAEWPDRILFAKKDRALMDKCLCGIEVKSSLKHYARWREAKKSALSITIKQEEIEDIEFWIGKFSKPVLFIQAFVDELYIASFAGMKDRIKRGAFRSRQEPLTDKQTLMFSISRSEPLLAAVKTDFSRFEIKGNGNVTRPKTWPAADITLQHLDITSLLSGNADNRDSRAGC
jgi:AccI restriction endonuclease